MANANVSKFRGQTLKSRTNNETCSRRNLENLVRVDQISTRGLFVFN